MEIYRKCSAPLQPYSRLQMMLLCNPRVNRALELLPWPHTFSKTSSTRFTFSLCLLSFFWDHQAAESEAPLSDNHPTNQLQSIFMSPRLLSQVFHFLRLFLFSVLTHHLKAGQEALEDVFTGVRQGEGTKFWHHDAVPFTILPVGLAVQEATHVGHLAFCDGELMQQRHPIKPVIVAVKKLTL